MESLSTRILPLGTVLEKLPLPGIRRMKACRAKLDEIVYRLINERRASGMEHDDLLQMLLIAQDEEDSTARMTDEQVRDEVMTIVLAGQLTTANALSWTWYLLSKHQEVENRLHEELDRVLGSRLPVLADLKALLYTEKVITESLRLYPPAWMTPRRALDDYQIGGYIAPARSIVALSAAALSAAASGCSGVAASCPNALAASSTRMAGALRRVLAWLRRIAVSVAGLRR